MKRAKFVVLEGMDGSGKSTQLEKLCTHFTGKGLSVLPTREPGGTELGNKVRQLITEQQTFDICPLSELFLIQACRAQHVETLLIPQLEKQDLIISDRYTASSIAYQGHGRKLPLDLVNALNQSSSQGLMPELTLILDLPAQESLKRAQSRLKSENSPEGRFEQNQLSFYEAVRNAYLELSRQNPETYILIDAEQSVDQIFETCAQKIEALLQL